MTSNQTPRSPKSSPINVLVVEDEPILLLYAIDLVEVAGHRAIKARSADEALRILTQRDDIRIVFTDIRMPGSIDGLTLATVIRERWPSIEVIMTSGHTVPDLAELSTRGNFFSKPYDAQSLIGALRALTK